MQVRLLATLLMTLLAILEGNTQLTTRGPTSTPTTASIQGTVVHNECMSSQCPLNENNLAQCLSGHWNCSDNEAGSIKKYWKRNNDDDVLMGSTSDLGRFPSGAIGDGSGDLWVWGRRVGVEGKLTNLSFECVWETNAFCEKMVIGIRLTDYCEILFSGQYTWYCNQILPGWSCQNIGTLCDPDVHSPGRLQYRYVCNYCCFDAQCMFDFHGISPSTPPRQGPTSSPTTALIQGTVVLNDCFSPRCTIELYNLADCLSGHWNCSDNEYCIIEYSGQYTWSCNPLPHAQLCQEHYICPPRIPAGFQPRQICHYCCDDAQCMYDFHGMYQETSSQGLTTVTPTGTSNAICVQCGDYDQGIPCSTMDLLFDTPSLCPMSGQNFCMTDTIIDSNGVASVFKRCVDQPTCESLWYLGSRDLIACRNFDSATTGAACHFCCIGYGCNTGAVPPGNTLYKNSA